MNIGIDKINFFTPNAYVDLVDVANARGIDPNKFTIGIGQNEMAQQPRTQDAYTMAANAAYPLMDEIEKEKIDLIIFGTESASDASKSGAVILQNLLGIQKYCRCYEIKQACYGATAGLMTAISHIHQHPESRVLVVGSDIARYGLATGGEVTQGAGAIAMIISANPSIMTFDEKTVAYSEDIYDFWRPNYSSTAFVDGKFSNEAYIRFFNETFHGYCEKYGTSLDDFGALLFHMPYTKMGLKALRSVLEEGSEETQERLTNHYEKAAMYTRRIGNLYTGSLYLSLISLLANDENISTEDTIGLFSYGSGAVGEFFTAKLVPGYEKHIHKEDYEALLNRRARFTVEQYEDLFNQTWLEEDGCETYQCDFDDAPFQLEKICDHRRYYKGGK